MNKNARIYIAGHLGMVGSAIHRNLQAKGYNNFILKSLDELDLTKQTDVEDFFNTEKPEYIFIAAAKVGGIIANNTYRAQFIYENLMIQNNIIHQSYVHGVKKLLFLGSTCIYPRNCPQPMKEEHLLTNTLEYTNEPYAIAKIAGIKMCESYNIQYGTNFLSVMPTNLYGPNDNFDLEKSHVLPALVRKIYLGKCLHESNWSAIQKDLNYRPIEDVSGTDSTETITGILSKYGITTNSIEIWGTGKPMREFLWSEEMADACVFVMENINFSELITNNQQNTAEKANSFKGKNEIRNTHINIGTGKEISIYELAHLVKRTIGYEGLLDFNTGKPDGTMRKLTDPSRLNNLGWQHKIEIKEGVKMLFDWYINN